MMYWGYCSFFGLIITLCYCIPFAMKDEPKTPYEQLKDFYEDRKRNF